jgi:hypothetical protein
MFQMFGLHLEQPAVFGAFYAYWVRFLLVGVNWGLESLKWQRLIYPLETPVFLPVVLKSVLCGVTVSMLTPNRTGEYVGRILNPSK